MIFPASIGRLLALSTSLFAFSQADTLVERISFGTGKSLSSDKSSLPGWQVSGQNFIPEVMSDRIILTPPYPGNKRGAIWGLEPLHEYEWTVDFEFRVNGDERAGGNIQLWYVKDGKSKVGTRDIYSIQRFDGMAITIDSSQGRGMIRGFLNDGSIDFHSHSLDNLAFGHCEYRYRNLGRPSHLKIKQTMFSFDVSVDGRTCFQTSKVSLPSGNDFGISASSTDNPDSFEAFRFLLSIPQNHHSGNTREHRPPPQNNPAQGHVTKAQVPHDGLADIHAQMKDIQTRLQSLTGTAEKLLHDFASLSQKFDDRNHELTRSSAHRDQVSSVDQRVMRVERMIEHIQKDLAGKDYQHHFNKLEEALHHSHSGVIQNLHDSSHRILSSAPRMGFFIFLLVAIQLTLAGAYVIYKKRRSAMPKKFL
ncbi:hypothetical protein LOZ12_002464 [Ophidiomyces ophidiicola]|uniref:Uncharacterized protein n=1 Tax=Ophidiomyces ophidiicola TaxID=1387563 RepID=A0ACB8V283_9EURO|nr:uncharacterized protein LOZ57_005894 [Ophidiomyces ophidiicola]KAI1912553.1 hypothetical protein LOZ61_003204 [Ophidiomyces ophidiicola]KAI1918300.1 hypothetical protein LOZ64_002874 [Ophidiomyces ophidiicola]KAI1927573.1 hypothetical protein LOZ60_003028 [Ophidiomyces ophidiicola]KAI1940751.1 hypothetical protein LOZ57_005894 [Ophidiomyces ophidiicola]KAI1951331.1 hypothetical protein LOZ62_001761 [Ophidiomyces ophidiicola]